MNRVAACVLFTLILAAPVHASVVETIVNEPLTGDLNLDVNGDGQTDFILENLEGESSHILSAQFQVVADTATGGVTFASAGSTIGPSTSFQPFVETGDVDCDFRGIVPVCSGLPFSETFFVGLKFPDLSDQIHFGWAQIGLEGRLPAGEGSQVLFPTLFAYAYETVPDTSIVVNARAVPEPVPPFGIVLAVMIYGVLRDRWAQRDEPD